MAALLEYKCPCCGGAIHFDSALQKMKCPFCKNEFDVETLKAYDEGNRRPPDDLSWETKPGSEWEGSEADRMQVYVCTSCGGEIVTDENTAATSCPYCDNPVVIKGRLSGSLKPDYVIPFQLDKAAAKAGLMKHLSGKRLLPKVFKKENHIDEIKGVYVPFWLFGADVDADIRYKATRTRFWSDANYNYTETSFYALFRSGKVAFDRVPVDGSAKMPDDLMESVEPFDFSGATDFQTAYLAGYLADKYDVTAEESIERANERIRHSTEQEFLSTTSGYESITPEESSIRLQNGNAKYALYPVWLLNTTWMGKKYTFAMNGQTGKFVGDLPLDKRAYWRWFGLITLIGSVAVYGLAWLIHLL